MIVTLGSAQRAMAMTGLAVVLARQNADRVNARAAARRELATHGTQTMATSVRRAALRAYLVRIQDPTSAMNVKTASIAMPRLFVSRVHNTVDPATAQRRMGVQHAVSGMFSAEGAAFRSSRVAAWPGWAHRAFSWHCFAAALAF
mmetsp:Transcript_15605/g.36833  ORF Transcript_15605/g.36833 Transcript_15605/m.36833 type:complete len:145 (+) Transcript_15605:458-892(+)